MKHIIAVLLENEPGALSRVVALFSARGYNIESLTVAPTEDASLSRMTIVTTGSDEVIEQITKHLNRLVDVVKVVDLTEGQYTERELMLIKVRAVGKEREEMKRMADIFRGRIIDVTEKTYTIEITGDSSKLDAFIEAVDRTAILETLREPLEHVQLLPERLLLGLDVLHLADDPVELGDLLLGGHRVHQRHLVLLGLLGHGVGDRRGGRGLRGGRPRPQGLRPLGARPARHPGAGHRDPRRGLRARPRQTGAPRGRTQWRFSPA